MVRLIVRFSSHLFWHSGQPHIVPLQCVLPAPHSKTGHVFVLKRLEPWDRRLHCTSVDRIVLFMRQLLKVRLTCCVRV